MSLPEKNTAPRHPLYPESYKAARSNMILGVLLWTGVMMNLAMINRGLSLKTDLGFAFKIFVLLTALGIAASLLPTIVGAKVLSIWLERRNTTKKSALIRGTLTGAFVISLFTVSMIIWFDFEIDDSFRSVILLLARFHLPIAICAALAGGRTGFQLAKFIETKKQTPLESAQGMPTETQS